MEILLVEDSLLSARMTVGALKRGRIPHRLTLVVDGEEAMQFLRRERTFARAPRPDLILLDLGLPKKDGREVLAEIRSDPILANLPVVVITSSEDEDDLVHSQLLGVDGYLMKPLDYDQFIALVKRLRNKWDGNVVLPSL